MLMLGFLLGLTFCGAGYCCNLYNLDLRLFDKAAVYSEVMVLELRSLILKRTFVYYSSGG